LTQVNVTTIDSYNFDKIDFIKIDTEGHELYVLEGAINTIEKYKPNIFIEVHPKELKKEKNAYNFLCDLGYKEKLKLGGSNFLMRME